MSYGREYMHQLYTSRCLGENVLSKGMKKILESLIHALMRVYYLGTLLEVKVTSVMTKRQRGLSITLVW